jgi:hypothetical protein
MFLKLNPHWPISNFNFAGTTPFNVNFSHDFSKQKFTYFYTIFSKMKSAETEKYSLKKPPASLAKHRLLLISDCRQ